MPPPGPPPESVSASLQLQKLQESQRLYGSDAIELEAEALNHLPGPGMDWKHYGQLESTKLTRGGKGAK